MGLQDPQGSQADLEILAFSVPDKEIPGSIDRFPPPRSPPCSPGNPAFPASGPSDALGEIRVDVEDVVHVFGEQDRVEGGEDARKLRAGPAEGEVALVARVLENRH